MAKRTQSAPVNLLTGLVKGGTRKPTVAKKDDRSVIVLDDPGVVKIVGDMIRLGVVAKEIGLLSNGKKIAGTDLLFRDWVHRYWNEKKTPDNPRYIIRRTDMPAVTDMECLFQVKFRSDGLDVSDLSDLPEGTTVEDTIVDALTSSVVGLTSKKAAALVNSENGEITVVQEVNFADSFNAMYNSDEPTLRSAADKVMSFLQAPVWNGLSDDDEKALKSLKRNATPAQKKLLEFLESIFMKEGIAFVDAVTPEEVGAIVAIRQVVRLKDGFLGRAFLYCETEEQLFNLLRFTHMTLLISSPKFAEADKKADRIGRMQDTLQEFLGTMKDGE